MPRFCAAASAVVIGLLAANRVAASSPSIDSKTPAFEHAEQTLNPELPLLQLDLFELVHHQLVRVTIDRGLLVERHRYFVLVGLRHPVGAILLGAAVLIV
ncbi:hypothetical protein JCM21900_001647 [Sporobolomyces salmonicolor]